MARTTGPLFSLAATGTLGKALTFSSVRGTSISKRKPTRATTRTRPERAARARMQFMQRAWTRDIIANGYDADWSEIAKQRAISPYNAFIGDGLERTNGDQGPRFSPTASIGTDPGSLTNYTAKISGATATLTANVAVPADMWGGWFYLLINPLDGCHPQTIATSFDALITNFLHPTAQPIRNLPRGSVWYVGWRTFSYDGILSAQAIPGSTIHIP